MKHFEEILCSIGAVNCTALLENEYWTLWSAEYRTPVSVVKGYYLYLKSKCPLLEATSTNVSNFRAKCESGKYDIVVTPKSDLAKDLPNTVAKFKGKSGYTTQTLLDEYLTGKITYKPLLHEEYFVAPSLTVNEQTTNQDALRFLTDWLTGEESTTRNSPIGIICADGGIGKTTLARELCESVRLRNSKVLPLLIESDQWKNIAGSGFTLETLWDIAIARRLDNASSLRADPSALRMLMQEGLLVVIFDGFDELAAMSSDKSRPQEILAELKERFTPEDEETKARVILTSRLTYWTAIKHSIPDLESIDEFRLNGFDNAQRKEYFQKRLPDPEQRDLAQRLAKEISGAIYANDAAVTVEEQNEDRISGTPFILSLIAYCIEGNENIVLKETLIYSPAAPLGAA